MRYEDAISGRKTELDAAMLAFKMQPVGSGYIDVITHRDDLPQAVGAISELGFLISDVSWWEHIAAKDQKVKCGMGGPISIFHPGWFAELQDFDEIDTALFQNIIEDYHLSDIIERNKQTLQIILDKRTMTYGDIRLEYRRDHELTAGLWIKVPDDWVSSLRDPITKETLPPFDAILETKRQHLLG